MSRYFRDKAHRGAPVDADYINGQTERTLENVTVAGGGSITRFSDNAIIKAGAGMGNLPGTPTVEVLPPIPAYGKREVFWTSEDGGTGDDQIWEVYAGQTKWTPGQNFTALDGTPIE